MKLRLTLLLSLAAWAVTATAAQAGEISAVGNTITFRADPGEANFFTVNWGNSGASSDFVPTFDDHVDIRIGANCEDFAGGVAVTCTSAGTNPTILIYLGDGNDIAQSINDRAAGHSVTFFGEDGDDDFDSDAGSDVLDGGPGNDEFSPDDNDPGPGDVVRGGPGIDTLQTGNPTGGVGPITVAFDDLPNDGYPGEGDNYASDLENLSATGTAPAIHFTGNDAPNVVTLRSESADIVRGLGGNDMIDGANGNDQLDGGDGDDTIYGGGNDDVIVGGPGVDSLSGEGSGSGLYVSIAGNDTIDARDGNREGLNCGPGADTAIVDALDIVPQDPGSLCEVVDRPLAAVAATVRSSKLKVAAKKRVSVSLACPAGVATCTGKVTLKTASKVRVGKKRSVVTFGSAKYSVAAGTSGNVRVNLSSKARSVLRKSKSVRVRITVAPASGAATTKTVTLRR
jgi:Ca2+-binding RTX toxin-like protein